MLELDIPLPDGALCAATPGALGGALDAAHWWHGAPAPMEVDGKTGAVTLWRAARSGPPLEPTDPNTSNGQVGEMGDLFGLQCRAGVHCGMVAEDAVPDAARATMAVRFYKPPGADAKTLLTLNATRTGNYLFLSETAGILTLKDDQDMVETTLPCPTGDAPRLAIVSVLGPQVALDIDGARTEAQSRAPILSGMASLFVGCRNHRPRLLKTIGSALILDVWLVPGRALLHEPAAPELKALRRHHFWAAA